MSKDRLFAGVDLGGTNMQFAVVSADGKIISRAKRKTRADESQEAVIGRLVSGIEEACTAAGTTPRGLVGVGIGAPGAVDPEQGVVLEAVNLRWDDVPLAGILQKRLGVPVFLDNDVNVAVFGENRAGAGRNARDLLGVWVGTGIGGGLILNGALYYGAFKTAGEIGHTILIPNNPPGSRSLEHNCSRTALVDRIVRLMRANRKSVIASLVDNDLSKVRSKTIAKAYESGDELTVEVVDDAAVSLGIAISNYVTVLSLGRVVIGGGLTEALGQPFVDKVQAAARRFAFPDRCKAVEVVASELEDDAGSLGAALIALERSDAVPVRGRKTRGRAGARV